MLPNAGRTFAVISLTRDLIHRYEQVFMGLSASGGTYFGLDMNVFNTAGSREGVYTTNNGYDTDLATAATVRVHVLSISSMQAGGSLPAVLDYSVDGITRTLTRTPGGNGNGLVEDFAGANYTSLGGAASGFAGAEMGDVLVWDRALTASERALVEAYFSSRYP